MDRLTQLQDALDNQLTLMYASINYIKTRHPYSDIPGQPSQALQPAPLSGPNSAAPQSAITANGEQPNGPSRPTQAAPAQPDPNAEPPPERPEAFNMALHELAKDLVLQEQQIEMLINSLPGLGNSESSQEQRMRELEAELREIEKEREKAEAEREKMLEELGGLLGGIRRVP